ncbi:MAG: hypothetical protein DDG59_08005 [Anaerolineae bacterium]|nr:MAG: hypothetical protein DDG59_08005 [Anaerolineae bacterium]
MPKRMVVLNYHQCDPQSCENGVCRAALICKRKVLRQDQPYELPELNSELCLGCAVCTTACSLNALQVLP